ncbi:MAG: 50S ribosomal protein L17, partial [Candidatus Gottesmanbacteria bacterium GW2011_GWC2_39_8]
TVAARRQIASFLIHKETARKLVDVIAPRFISRPGGYTRIIKLGRRTGDNAEEVMMEWVDHGKVAEASKTQSVKDTKTKKEEKKK